MQFIDEGMLAQVREVENDQGVVDVTVLAADMVAAHKQIGPIEAICLVRDSGRWSTDMLSVIGFMVIALAARAPGPYKSVFGPSSEDSNMHTLNSMRRVAGLILSRPKVL